MFLITGASGTIGSEVVRQLVAHGNRVRAMTRTPGAVGLPVPVVQGDLEKPESLAEAVDGVESVFLLTAPGPWVPEHDRAMVRAASAAGVRKIVKLSAIGGSDEKLPGSWHVAGEQAVRDSGLAWTILRPAGFASNALRWASAVRAGQPVPNLTGSGRHGFVDPRDVAAVAVETLPLGSYDGEVLTLTGPELLSVSDQAARLSAVLRREVDVVDVPPSIAEEQMLAAGFHEAVVTVALRGAELIRTGGAETLTTDIERVLGRPPGTFRAWLETHRAAFA
ncbi:uncharacterized protein YbjT (DUF2867 family) [Kribbella voronezhensis]|uniref:Uncharacterized protein YbjT (DUF2867 family) n=1 Tax=Kribbella voronezhensis TaxID=2512212 RepID=A0A4R7TI56_9ACTN|nr:NAD(P)H-binding protein [Kribbella voronezhensis]TDU91599.1 uncharacterized protein YbjT (DUF2867 family) [Kribbella voronezhensis]